MQRIAYSVFKTKGRQSRQAHKPKGRQTMTSTNFTDAIYSKTNIYTPKDLVDMHPKFTNKEAHRIIGAECVLEDYSAIELRIISALIDETGRTRLTLQDIVNAYEAVRKGEAATVDECAFYIFQVHGEIYPDMKSKDLDGILKGMVKVSRFYNCED